MRARLRRLTARNPPWSFWLPELLVTGSVIAVLALTIAWLLARSA